jgi:hypothetical protein
VRRPVAVAVALAAALVLTGCTPDSRTGVAVDAAGLPVLVTALCSDERVRVVELRTNPLADVEDDVPDDLPDAEVLWRIESEAGSDLEQYVIGSEPPGFVTDVPLDDALPDDALALAFDSTKLGESVTFSLDELALLRPGELLYLGDLAEAGDLREAADEGGRCGNDVIGDVARFGILAGATLAVLAVVGGLVVFATGGLDRRRRPRIDA